METQYTIREKTDLEAIRAIKRRLDEATANGFSIKNGAVFGKDWKYRLEIASQNETITLCFDLRPTSRYVSAIEMTLATALIPSQLECIDAFYGKNLSEALGNFAFTQTSAQRHGITHEKMIADLKPRVRRMVSRSRGIENVHKTLQAIIWVSGLITVIVGFVLVKYYNADPSPFIILVAVPMASFSLLILFSMLLKLSNFVSYYIG